MTSFVYLAYLSCFLVFKFSKEEDTDDRPLMPLRMVLIPAFFDFLSSPILLIGVSMVAASVYQMIRGLQVVIVCFYSILFFWWKYYRAHWTGIMLITGGALLVGYGGMEEGEDKTSLTGLALVLFGTLLTSAILITEEFIMRRYRSHPLWMVGGMGLFELPALIVVLVSLNFISCSNSSFCFYGCPEDSWLAVR